MRWGGAGLRVSNYAVPQFAPFGSDSQLNRYFRGGARMRGTGGLCPLPRHGCRKSVVEEPRGCLSVRNVIIRALPPTHLSRQGQSDFTFHSSVHFRSDRERVEKTNSGNLRPWIVNSLCIAQSLSFLEQKFLLKRVLDDLWLLLQSQSVFFFIPKLTR